MHSTLVICLSWMYIFRGPCYSLMIEVLLGYYILSFIYDPALYFQSCDNLHFILCASAVAAHGVVVCPLLRWRGACVDHNLADGDFRESRTVQRPAHFSTSRLLGGVSQYMRPPVDAPLTHQAGNLLWALLLVVLINTYYSIEQFHFHFLFAFTGFGCGYSLLLHLLVHYSQYVRWVIIIGVNIFVTSLTMLLVMLTCMGGAFQHCSL